MLTGIFCTVKLFEVVHAVLMEDNILNGTIIDSQFSFTPAAISGADGSTVYGARAEYRF